MRESKVKALLIDLLLEESNDIKSITHEVRFADGKRRADLICINEYIHAFEIKTEFDNLSSLWDQVKDYQKSFQSLTLVVAVKYLKEVFSNCPTSVGVIVIDETGIKRIRKPKIRIKLKKTEVLNLLSLARVKKELAKMGKSTKGMTVIEARAVLAKNVKLDYCLYLVRSELLEKSLESFRAFISERGDATTIEDLKLFKLASWNLFFEDESRNE